MSLHPGMGHIMPSYPSHFSVLPLAVGLSQGSQRTATLRFETHHSPFSVPPAHSVSGQAAVIAPLQVLGSPFWDQAVPLPSPLPPRASRTAWHAMREPGARSCCHHGWSQEGVQDPLLEPHAGAAPAFPPLHVTSLGSCHVQSSFLTFACDKRFSTWGRDQVLIY